MRVACYIGDCAGCFYFRVALPFRELKKYDVEVTYFPFRPGEPEVPPLFTVINSLKDFDLVIVQRAYLKELVLTLRQACNFVGIPLVFETDDDYLSLVPSNPCYFALADQGLFNHFSQLKYQAEQAAVDDLTKANELVAQANELIPHLLESRKQGEEDYKDILRIVDAVTVSTEELARTIRPYNKNVAVFENMVEQVNPYRHCIKENDCVTFDETGKPINLNIPVRHHLTIIPQYAELVREGGVKEFMRTPRIAYAGSASHFPDDWNTIVDPLNNVIEKYNHCWWFYMGDRVREDSQFGGIFSNTQKHNRGRIVTNFGLPFDMYLLNLHNADIFLCCLDATVFNMSKSDIKAVEGGSVGACPLVPNYITYTRHWKDGDNCLVFKDKKDFEVKLSHLIENHKDREELGRNALNYVKENRLQKYQSAARFEFYNDLVTRFPRLKIFLPNKEKVDATPAR